MIGCWNGKLSFNKICRLCMRQEGAMSSMFTDDSDGVIPDRIWYSLSLKVLANDGLPMLICAQCIYQLDCSFKFKTQCENSDATLRKYLSNIRLNTEIKKEFQDGSSKYDNTLNWDEDKDCINACTASASNQLLVFDSPNQQVKVENVDELPSTHDTVWHCSESTAEDPANVNQYGTSNEVEQRIGVNTAGASIHITSTKYVSCNEEERNQVNLSMGFPNTGTTIYVSKNTETSRKEPQIKVKMKERKRMLENNFRRENIYVNKACNMLVTSETNQNPKKAYTCQWCFQSYAGRSGLWQHLQKHSGRQYVCKVCNKHFTRGNILKQHERIHSEDSSGIMCRTCKKTFLNVMQLKRHEICHLVNCSNRNMYT